MDSGAASKRPASYATCGRHEAMLAEELSCSGTVTHIRRAPMRHVFRYRVWMLYMRLGPDGAGPALWPRLLASSDKGHLMSEDGVRSKLDAAGFAESEVASMDLFALTQPRSLGFSFNPVNFYFCLAGERLAALLLDVNNTPWDERHCYVLLPAEGDEGANDASFRFAKRFHVSPFLPMDGRYTLHLKASGDALRIAMRFDGGTAPFSACLSLKTRPLARSEVVRSALRQPAQGVLTLARIYWQAGRLFLKRAPFHAHPAKRRAMTPLRTSATRAADAAAVTHNGSTRRPGERGS
ncbi:MAG: DUF1365 domain-containing protein [Gammaproteobacteria bacterium]|nr:DUF1365 domain-containing protein [Gammaproteobacteria bacterium]